MVTDICFFLYVAAAQSYDDAAVAGFGSIGEPPGGYAAYNRNRETWLDRSCDF